MGLPRKLPVLLAVLIADLLFFLFFSVHYPETFEVILQLLPWEDNIEKVIMIILGLIIAVSSSTATIHVLMKEFRKMMK